MIKPLYLLLGLLFSVPCVMAVAPTPPAGLRWRAVDALTDEFNDASMDSTKWDGYHPHWSGRAPSQFKVGNAYVSGGYLNLKSTMRLDPTTVADPFSDIWVDSAACVSKGWSAKPGYYYEARFKASNLSMTSSFWFRVGDYSEIDVIEHIGNASNPSKAWKAYEYHANTHVYGSQSGSSVGEGWTMPTRGRDEFHTYGFWWKDPTNLWFYHNDVKVMEITPSVPFDEDLKMIFDTEVFPWATAGVANIGLPLPENLNDDSKNTMQVDWVRTYALETAPVVQPFSEIVQAEDFDSYYDTTAANQGGAYRPNEGVDIEVAGDTGGGYNVGWTADGEWLEYTRKDFPAGIDTLALRVASIHSDRALQVALDGTPLGSIAVPNTGDWQVYDTIVMSNLNVVAGAEHTVRVTFAGGGVNLNYLELYGAQSFSGWSRSFAQAIGTRDDDFDLDDQSNFYEYVFGGNPTNPAQQGRNPYITRLGDGSLGVVYPRRRDDTQLVYTIESRTNLMAGTWTPVASTPLGTDPMGAYDQTTNGVPSLDGARYFRVRVSEPSP